MNSDWQTAVALVIVALAVIGLLGPKLRKRKFSFERDTHCGYVRPKRSTTHSSIVFHVRKGERPQVIVKTKPGSGRSSTCA
ncbi:MAG TPA: hypothetical protein PKN95_02935 [Verrucomicrobiota bacterium]|nr:hypothetical protein [Verrucomicrobiota bacterium]HNT13267.1 hypothetical protein [Verrucomicrobiota bacterium]